MSVTNTFNHNSKVKNFTQNTRSNSESDEERKKNRKPSKSSKFDEDSKPELGESTSSSGSNKAIPQYDVEKRGLIVIFNQEKFPDGSNERNGTMEDVNALKKSFFDENHFKVICKHDMSKELVQAKIKSIATSKKYKDYSYVIIFFLSHGDIGGTIKLFCGNDITNEEIWQPFCSMDSIWKDKPKFFFFQACKGGEYTFIDNSNQPNTEVFTDMGKAHKMVPKEADVLVGYSTVEGNISVRTSSGTWYIQKLCEIINAYSKCDDILQILTRVNHEIANNCKVPGMSITNRSELKDKTIKQMPMFSSTLTKQFYFYSQVNRR